LSHAEDGSKRFEEATSREGRSELEALKLLLSISMGGGRGATGNRACFDGGLPEDGWETAMNRRGRQAPKGSGILI
jgi:hypothetical protein